MIIPTIKEPHLENRIGQIRNHICQREGIRFYFHLLSPPSPFFFFYNYLPDTVSMRSAILFFQQDNRVKEIKFVQSYTINRVYKFSEVECRLECA